MMAKSLAMEWAEYGVLVCPLLFLANSPLMPVGQSRLPWNGLVRFLAVHAV